MIRRITLVRHAMPLVVRDVEPARWVLTADGQTAAAALRLPGVSAVTSPELKAAATLRAAGVIAREDAAFAEVARPGEPVDDDPEARRSRRRSWVEGYLDARHLGWETPLAAARRFAGGIEQTRGDVVVGTHGLVMTAWLVTIGAVDPAEAGAFWESLALPAVVTVVLQDGRGRLEA